MQPSDFLTIKTPWEEVAAQGWGMAAVLALVAIVIIARAKKWI